MKYRFFLGLGVCTIVFMHSLCAMKSEKAAIKADQSAGICQLIFERYNKVLAQDISATQLMDRCEYNMITEDFDKMYLANIIEQDLIDSVIKDDEEAVQQFFNDFRSNLLTVNACIIALYYAYQKGHCRMEQLLATNPSVQQYLLSDYEVGIGLLVFLSLEYTLPDIFNTILGYDHDTLRFVPPFCWNKALQFAVENNMDDIVICLLEHSFISRRLSLKVLIAVRRLSRNKPYLGSVRQLIVARLNER